MMHNTIHGTHKRFYMKPNRYFLNTTAQYHISHLTSLGWELTVCNALAVETSPCRKALKTNASFGVHLCRFLEKHMNLHDVKNVLEVGGGLGYLMRDILNQYPRIQAAMLDISPFLLQKQIETLSDRPVNFREMDFLSMEPDELRVFDFVILNENLGDFPTLVCASDAQTVDLPVLPPDALIDQAEEYRRRYGLTFGPSENINIGALDAVEKLCRANVPYIYLSEHSCEALPPEELSGVLKIIPSGNPERISLKGHAEYTIKFSHLQTLAEKNGYRAERGLFADFLIPDFNDTVRAALRTASPVSDEQEIIQQFIYDLYKYEYLILIKR